MVATEGRYRIFLEVGEKKVFAGAVDWPGWRRWGKDEALASDEEAIDGEALWRLAWHELDHVWEIEDRIVGD